MHNYDCTFLGLHKWHDTMFEKLGWMAMAHQHKNELKIKAYKESIQHLLECLQRKHNTIRDLDHKDDLKILIENVQCLQHCAHTLLDGTQHHHSDEDCKSGENSHDATFHGLHHWMKNKYEKLGWMCLAKKHGNTLKIKAYIDSIERLRASLEKKLNSLEEQDRKTDIKILHDDVCVLQCATEKVLGQSKRRTKTSTRKYTYSHH